MQISRNCLIRRKFMAVQDLHMHTTWCDGKNTPEEMIISGINKGLNKIGITAHAYTWFDDTYCLKKEDYPAFKKEVRELAVKYKDKIEVLCGIEQDYYSDMSTEGFDYIIGSNHYLKVGEEYYPIDSGEEGFVKLAGLYDGDYLSMCEAYYKNVGDPRFDCFLNYVLNSRLIHYREHFLWQNLSCRQYSCSKPCSWYNGFCYI